MAKQQAAPVVLGHLPEPSVDSFIDDPHGVNVNMPEFGAPNPALDLDAAQRRQIRGPVPEGGVRVQEVADLWARRQGGSENPPSLPENAFDHTEQRRASPLDGSVAFAGASSEESDEEECDEEECAVTVRLGNSEVDLPLSRSKLEEIHGLIGLYLETWRRASRSPTPAPEPVPMAPTPAAPVPMAPTPAAPVPAAPVPAAPVHRPAVYKKKKDGGRGEEVTVQLGAGGHSQDVENFLQQLHASPTGAEAAFGGLPGAQHQASAAEEEALPSTAEEMLRRIHAVSEAAPAEAEQLQVNALVNAALQKPPGDPERTQVLEAHGLTSFEAVNLYCETGKLPTRPPSSS